MKKSIQQILALIAHADALADALIDRASEASNPFDRMRYQNAAGSIISESQDQKEKLARELGLSMKEFAEDLMLAPKFMDEAELTVAPSNLVRTTGNH